MGSKKFTLDLSDVKNLLKNAALVAGAAFLTTLVNNMAHLDLGQYTPLIVPIVTMVLDSAIKWIKDNTEKEEAKGE